MWTALLLQNGPWLDTATTRLEGLIRTLRQSAEALQHAYGGAGCVAAVALPLELVVAGQDGVGLLRDLRLKVFYYTEISLHLFHGPQSGRLSRHP